jgi:hypothetical protein
MPHRHRHHEHDARLANAATAGRWRETGDTASRVGGELGRAFDKLTAHDEVWLIDTCGRKLLLIRGRRLLGDDRCLKPEGRTLVQNIGSTLSRIDRLRINVVAYAPAHHCHGNASAAEEASGCAARIKCALAESGVSPASMLSLGVVTESSRSCGLCDDDIVISLQTTVVGS